MNKVFTSKKSLSYLARDGLGDTFLLSFQNNQINLWSGAMLIMSNRKTPNFATQLFSDEKRDLICVKEFAKYSFCSPKFFATQKTFLNANIKKNKFNRLKWEI